MQDTKLLLEIEAKKKSVFLGALMNFFIPGAVQIYCGKVALGIGFFVVSLIIYGVLVSQDLPDICTFYAIGCAIGGAVFCSKYNKEIIVKALESSKDSAAS